MDPHGAVAYHGLKQYLAARGEGTGIFLETAHPVKFYDVVEQVVEAVIDLPPAIQAISDKQKSAVQIGTDYEGFRNYLLSIK
ncbi:MAG: hypothetical protein EOO01_20045 [Chitinophagaceae bacterium]|nr:MAG: hypothetical protein EOO01_20045 [Chitinophagaceae bacterium]